MTEEFKKISGDDYWYRQGEKRCICGHWAFQHELTMKELFHLGDAGFCHDCTCEKFKREQPNLREDKQ